MTDLSMFVSGLSLQTVNTPANERLSEALQLASLIDYSDGWKPSPASISPRARKRLSPQTLLAISVAEQISPVLGEDAAWVFGSAFGEGETLKIILDALRGPEMAVRPLRFQNSVHNAASGQWTIARQSQGAATSICAGAGTAAASLLKAAMQVQFEQKSIGLVLYDAPLPFPLSTSHRVSTPGAAALALSSVASETTMGRMRLRYQATVDAQAEPLAAKEALTGTNPSLEILPVFERLAGIETGPVELQMSAGATLLVEVTLC